MMLSAFVLKLWHWRGGSHHKWDESYFRCLWSCPSDRCLWHSRKSERWIQGKYMEPGKENSCNCQHQVESNDGGSRWRCCETAGSSLKSEKSYETRPSSLGTNKAAGFLYWVCIMKLLPSSNFLVSESSPYDDLRIIPACRWCAMGRTIPSFTMALMEEESCTIKVILPVVNVIFGIEKDAKAKTIRNE